MFILGEIAQIVDNHLDDPLLPRTTDNAVFKGPGKHVGKNGENVKPHNPTDQRRTGRNPFAPGGSDR
jgi:hypothetical protein